MDDIDFYRMCVILVTWRAAANKEGNVFLVNDLNDVYSFIVSMWSESKCVDKLHERISDLEHKLECLNFFMGVQ